MMLKPIFSFGMALYLAAAFMPVVGQAEKLAPANVAVLNSAKVLRESKPAKSIERQIDAYREKYRKETAAEEKELRNQQARLRQKQSVMSKEAFAKETVKFRKQQDQLTRSVRERSARLKASLQKALYQLNNELLAIISILSVQVGANLIIDRKELVYYAKAIDITDQAIKELNAKLGEIKVKDPAKIK